MSDNAQEFTSAEMKQYLHSCNVKQRLVTPLHPAANGEVERQNRSLLKRMRIAKASGKDWKREIYDYVFAYRNTPHSVTGIAPAEMFFRRKLRTKLPDLSLYSESTINVEEAKDRDRWQKARTKEYSDARKHATDRDLKIGDKVLMRQRRQTKLDTPFEIEPHRLVSKTGNSCVVQSERDPNVVYKRNSTHIVKYHDSNANSSTNASCRETGGSSLFEYHDNDDLDDLGDSDTGLEYGEHQGDTDNNVSPMSDELNDGNHDVLGNPAVRTSARVRRYPLKFHDEFDY